MHITPYIIPTPQHYQNKSQHLTSSPSQPKTSPSHHLNLTRTLSPPQPNTSQQQISPPQHINLTTSYQHDLTRNLYANRAGSHRHFPPSVCNLRVLWRLGHGRGRRRQCRFRPWQSVLVQGTRPLPYRLRLDACAVRRRHVADVCFGCGGGRGVHARAVLLVRAGSTDCRICASRSVRRISSGVLAEFISMLATDAIRCS